MGNQFPRTTDFARSDADRYTFHASAEQKGSGVIIDAEGVVKTSEFGVKPITYSGAKVNDEVNVMVRDLPVKP